MKPFFSTYGIRLLLTVKFILLMVIISQYSKIFTIGEKQSLAQNSEVNQGQSSSTDGERQQKEESNSQNQKNTSSLLDEMLNLPVFNTESMKKEELGRYLKLIERKRYEIEGRIKVLDTRQTRLNSLEGSIDNKLKKLEEEMSFFQQTQQTEKKVKEERLKNLISFYEKMEPKKAAPVFEQLDRDLVVALFNSIPKKQTTKILGLMAPEKSVALSEYYGRIRSAKEYDLLKEINVELLKEFENCKTN